jgi:hypothetical protein
MLVATICFESGLPLQSGRVKVVLWPLFALSGSSVSPPSLVGGGFLLAGIPAPVLHFC